VHASTAGRPDGDYAMYIDATDDNIQPHENAFVARRK
jgi:hypothetical protein